jgi:hypothetical protein
MKYKKRNLNIAIRSGVTKSHTAKKSSLSEGIARSVDDLDSGIGLRTLLSNNPVNSKLPDSVKKLKQSRRPATLSYKIIAENK